MKITKTKGLRVSEKVLAHLKRDPRIKNLTNAKGELYIGTFTNCREVGLTYTAIDTSGNSFTWCTYEHRNSDQVILNGKEGYVSMNGDLPYKSDDKWDYIAAFGPDNEFQAATRLATEIVKFLK